MFAVFGINQAKARAMAIKKTPKTTGIGANLRQLTPEEYQALLDANTEKYMQQMRPVILSGEFATPDTCQQFIAMAVQGGATRCSVMIKAPVERKTKGGKTSISKSWQKYHSGKDYQLKNQQLF